MLKQIMAISALVGLGTGWPMVAQCVNLRESSKESVRTRTEPVAPPIDAAKAGPPLPSDAELQMKLGNEVRGLLKDRKDRLSRLSISQPSATRRLQREIQVLEDRLTSGPDVNMLVDGIAEQVETIRNLRLKDKLSVTVLDREQMQYLVETKLEEDMPPDHLRRSELLLKSVGALPRSVNLRRILVRLISEQAAGLYDPSTKKLYVAASFSLDKPIARIILAHEICHALQDQHFNIRKLMKDVAHHDDQAMARLSIIEGDATALMANYAIQHLGNSSPLDFAEILTQEQGALRATPYYLRKSLVFPYLAGQEFMLTATAHDVIGNKDGLFRRPPTSTEQIIHPAKYFERTDEPTRIPEWNPDLDFLTTVSANSLGEFGILTILDLWKEPRAKDIAMGWDGDWLQVWTTSTSQPLELNDRTLEARGLSLSWASAWDSDQDAEEFASGIGRVFQRGPLARELGAAPELTTEVLSVTWSRSASPDQVYVTSLRGPEVTLRVFRSGRKVFVLAASGPARVVLDSIKPGSIADYLGAIRPRD